MNIPELNISKICKRIAHARKLKEFTQKELSKKIGKAAVTVSDYENLRAKPSIDIIQKISEALDIPTTYLLYDSEIIISIGNSNIAAIPNK